MTWSGLSCFSLLVPPRRVVYVFGAGNRCKIGVSINPHQRSKQLATQSGQVFDDQFVLDADYDAWGMERELHAQFSDARGVGEWFSCAARHIVELAKVDFGSFPSRQKERNPGFDPNAMVEAWKAFRHSLQPADPSAYVSTILACLVADRASDLGSPAEARLEMEETVDRILFGLKHDDDLADLVARLQVYFQQLNNEMFVPVNQALRSKLAE